MNRFCSFFIIFSILMAQGNGCEVWGRAPCRYRNENRIVGGEKTDIKRVPYQASLLFEKNLLCGGSVVSSRHVVTAAHCIVFFLHPMSDDDQKLYVRVGSNHTDRGGVVVKVKKSICHPKFDLEDYDYDICILELDEVLLFNDNIRPVKIAEAEPQEEETGIVAGWGALWQNGKFPKDLYSVSLLVVNRTFCDEVYQKIGPITDRMICAGSEGKDSCQGDSGGGLVVDGALVGISSTGFGCGLKNYPGVYTSVGHPEINQFVEENIHF